MSQGGFSAFGNGNSTNVNCVFCYFLFIGIQCILASCFEFILFHRYPYTHSFLRNTAFKVLNSGLGYGEPGSPCLQKYFLVFRKPCWRTFAHRLINHNIILRSPLVWHTRQIGPLSTVWKYFGNFLEKVEKSNFHSFVQFHRMEMLFVVGKYSRNILEIFWK